MTLTAAEIRRTLEQPVRLPADPPRRIRSTSDAWMTGGPDSRPAVVGELLAYPGTVAAGIVAAGRGVFVE